MRNTPSNPDTSQGNDHRTRNGSSLGRTSYAHGSDYHCPLLAIVEDASVTFPDTTLLLAESLTSLSAILNRTPDA